MGVYGRKILVPLLILCAVGPACATQAYRPCTRGGEPAREKPTRGTRQCVQYKDRNGQWANHGPYREWHLNGELASEGEYKWGKKQGKWQEWDETGKRISEKFFEDGNAVPPPR